MPDTTPHTNVHTFLVAQPGVWMPVTMKSPIPEPSTWEQYDELIARASEDLGVPSQYVKLIGTIELVDEPWVEPRKESPIVVPNKNLIVPPGVKR
jgi:hypothetical protein